MKKFIQEKAKMIVGVVMMFALGAMSMVPAEMTYAKPTDTVNDSMDATGNSNQTINVDKSGSGSTSTGFTGGGCTEEQRKNGCVSTAILGENGCSCDDGNGSSVKNILKLVVEIMTVGVGILSVIGISVVGVQYLTAGGDEAQTRKAKRRMLEIVIGVVLYVAAFALMSWLIPDFKPFQ